MGHPPHVSGACALCRRVGLCGDNRNSQLPDRHLRDNVDLLAAPITVGEGNLLEELFLHDCPAPYLARYACLSDGLQGPGFRARR
jgi:hypothetical protein